MHDKNCSSSDRCKFMHNLYIGEIWRPGGAISLLTVCAGLYLTLHSKLWKKWSWKSCSLWMFKVIQDHPISSVTSEIHQHIDGKLQFYNPTVVRSCESCRNLPLSMMHVRPEAQLSQRDRAMLCVTEYFAKSLNVIENGTIRKLGYSFLSALHSNYGSVLYHF